MDEKTVLDRLVKLMAGSDSRVAVAEVYRPSDMMDDVKAVVSGSGNGGVFAKVAVDFTTACITTGDNPGTAADRMMDAITRNGCIVIPTISKGSDMVVLAPDNRVLPTSALSFMGAMLLMLRADYPQRPAEERVRIVRTVSMALTAMRSRDDDDDDDVDGPKFDVPDDGKIAGLCGDPDCKACAKRKHDIN